MSDHPDTMAIRPIVSLVQVYKSYAGVAILNGISMDVAEGEVVCLIGPSGSGKSTVLRCINGLVPVDRGEIRVGELFVHALKTDRDKAPLRKLVSIVFQQYNLFPHKTALQNVMMAPIHVLDEDRKEVEHRARALLATVRLEGKEDAYPRELSGGQQQRVAIARALAMRPKVMLFDEVTAALDPETVREVLATIQELAAGGMTCILVTHEMHFAREVASRVYFMDRGAIVEHGPAQQFFDDPRQERSKAFLSRVL